MGCADIHNLSENLALHVGCAYPQTYNLPDTLGMRLAQLWRLEVITSH